MILSGVKKVGRLRTWSLFLGFTLLIGASSNKEIYDNIQLNNRQNCLKLPQSQYDECIVRFSKSYDEYERERL